MKKAVVLALAAFFTTAWVTPALAGEFSYGGFMRYRYITGNPGTANLAFEAIGDADAGVGGFFRETDKTGSAWEYRWRQYFNYKVNDHVSTNIKFELNSFFGQENVLGGGAGDINIGAGNEGQFRIKNAFVRFDLPDTPLTLTVGQQDFSTPKALISVEDGTGIKATFSAAGGTHTLFWQRLTSGDNSQSTADDADWFGFVPTFDLQGTTVSPHVSYIRAGRDAVGTGAESSTVFYLGVDISGKAGPVGYTFDAVYQNGEIKGAGLAGDLDVASYIVDASATLNAGPGALTLKLLYSPGDDNLLDDELDAWQNFVATDLGFAPLFFDGTSGSRFFGNPLPSPSLALDLDGDAVVDGDEVFQADTGVMALGAEFAFSPVANLTLTPNIYYLKAAEDNPINGEDFYGIEAGIQANWKIWDAMTLLGQLDYLSVGDFFKTTSGKSEDVWRVVVGPTVSW